MAAELAGVSLDLLPSSAEERRIGGGGEPPVAVAGGPLKATFVPAGADVGRDRPLNGLGEHGRVFQAEEAALEVDRRLGPQPAHDLQDLREARPALVVGQAAVEGFA